MDSFNSDTVIGMVDVHWLAITPEIVLLITASFVLLFGLSRKNSHPSAIISGMGLLVAFVVNSVLFAQSGNTTFSSFGLRYLADSLTLGFQGVILLGGILAVCISYDYLQRSGLEQPEYYPLLLLSTLGAMVLAAAGDLITLVLGLEIMSLAVYVLSAWRDQARESEEAGMKYFLLGAFASAFLIYGIALTYGATGHFTFHGIARAASAEDFSQLLLLSLATVFMLAGLGFKVALAPFHQWAPDVYTGAPTAVTAFMSVVVKTAAFAALLRVTMTLFPSTAAIVSQSFALLVGLTLIIANFAALMQRGVKRMLAYSAVGHAGYLALAVLAANVTGMRAALWYLTAYTLMNAGAFAVLTLLCDKHDFGDDLERFAGLGRSKPWLAFAMTIFLLSLAGIPPLAGFTGKVLVFQAAIEAGYVALAVLAILTSAVAVVYYFRVVVYMYFREAEYEPLRVQSRATQLAIGIAVAGTIGLGLLPGWWYGALQTGYLLLTGS